MTLSDDDRAFVRRVDYDRIPPKKSDAFKALRAEIRRRLPAPTAAEIKAWNAEREFDVMERYSKRTGVPFGSTSKILQIGWANARGELNLKGTMTMGLKGTYKSKAAANRRRYRSISSGAPITVQVKKACALVRTTVGGKRITKPRKGCRLTKSGARCDELTRLPERAYDRKAKVWVDCK